MVIRIISPRVGIRNRPGILDEKEKLVEPQAPKLKQIRIDIYVREGSKAITDSKLVCTMYGRIPCKLRANDSFYLCPKDRQALSRSSSALYSMSMRLEKASGD